MGWGLCCSARGVESLGLLLLLRGLAVRQTDDDIQHGRNAEARPERIDREQRQRADLAADEPDDGDDRRREHGRERARRARLLPEERADRRQEQPRRVDGKRDEQDVHDILREPPEHRAKHTHKQRRGKADAHQGLFRRPGMEIALVNILRQAGRAREHRDVRRGHDGAEHTDEHKALEPVREELDHERRDDIVRRREIGQDELSGHTEEGARPGDDEHEHGRIDRAGAGGPGVLGRDAAGVAVHAREKRHDCGQAQCGDRRPAPRAEVKEARRQVGGKAHAVFVQHGFKYNAFFLIPRESAEFPNKDCIKRLWPLFRE